MSKYDDLVRKLKEIFQIDRPELDFGVYRILNARVGEINDYLEKRLKAKVAQSLANASQANVEHVRFELAEAEKNAGGLGINPDNVPKVLELRQKIAEYGTGASEHENAVFTHLLTFFSRYYNKGDFVSQRRYKGDTYAIPYAGEEVVLHWANKDQYYTKSGENFANYGFKLDDGRSVHFRLVAADTAKDNRKDNDKERQFTLIEQHTRTLVDEEGEEYEEELLPVMEEAGELVLRFEYKAMPKGSKQERLVEEAAKTVLNHPTVKARWLDLNKREPTEKNPQRTLLEKCLTSYTTKNSADYFIHKDLGGFLRRELDFYIKNEIMNLDDVQHAGTFADIEKNLRLIQTLRAIALDLITFLAQLEDFQKKLWLKKKFVVAAHYCVTLDRIPESLYSAIAANPRQWEQWEQMGMLVKQKQALINQAKVGTVEFLKIYPSLMVDTALFDVRFKQSLLKEMDNLEKNLDGLLIHGDNFQALNLLKDRFREQVKCVYIDPPYNTSASEIAYKNSYKHSSWLSLIHDRINIGRILMSEDAVFSVAIDDAEFSRMHILLLDMFGHENHLATVVVRAKPQGRAMAVGFSPNHEYAVFFSKTSKASVGRLPRDATRLSRYAERDGDGIFAWSNFRGTGANSYRKDRPKLFFPIWINIANNEIEIPQLEWSESERVWLTKEAPVDGQVVLFPVDDDDVERVWTLGWDRARKEANAELIAKNMNGKWQVQRKYRPNQEGALPGTWWADPKYSASESGTKVLQAIIGDTNTFPYPKSLFTVEDCIRSSGIGVSDCVLDFFGGSATTGHAVINLNRQDKGRRRYILIEQGEYFDTTLKPRLQKVVYSADWKDGKATAPQTGISHAFKILKIEGYEDTLNNLQLRRTPEQQSLLDTLPSSVQDEYLLRYMLDIESRGALLSIEHFNKPFDYVLKVAVDSAGAYENRNIDLVETFNYLIGLRVKYIDMQQEKGFVTVSGWLPTGEKTLIVWRDYEKIGYDELWSEQDLSGKERARSILGKLNFNPRDSEFEVVYINGDHNIPAVFTSLATEGGVTKSLKIRQIEPEFLNLMFAGEGM